MSDNFPPLEKFCLQVEKCPHAQYLDRAQLNLKVSRNQNSLQAIEQTRKQYCERCRATQFLRYQTRSHQA